MSAARAALVALALLGMVGCANGSGPELELTVDGERPGLAGQRLGAPRESVLAALAARGATASECETVKLTPRRGRKAFARLRCVHRSLGTPAPRLGGQPVEALVTHFVDGVLVRIDARLLAPEGAPSSLGARLERSFGRPDAVAGDGVTRWTHGEDRVELHGRSGAERSPARLVLLDGVAAETLPALSAPD